jgi:2,5-furandicarboxylate decarboxylase 1
VSTKDLRQFVEDQEAAGWVERVDEELDVQGEAARALACRQGHIVVLEKVRGFEGTPVISGVAGSRELVAAAVGASAHDDAVRLLAEKMDRPGPITVVRDAPCLENVLEDGFDVGEIVPMLRHDPGSASRYTSASIVVARSRQHGQNLSFHRMMYLGQNRFSVRIVPRHLRMILDEAGGTAEVAVVIGVHPAVALAAATSGGPEFDELGMAASLLGGLEVVHLGELLVPAASELVMVGRFTGELGEEGPFVDLTGTLDGTRQQPILEIHRVLHRTGYLYHAIVPGGVEHRLLMGTPQEPRILRAAMNAFPRVHAVALSQGGCSWLHAVIALDRPRTGQAVNVGMAALGAHPSLKRVVIVDRDVDVHDAEQVEWAIATRVQPDRDIVVIPGARGSSLDPSREPAEDTTAKWIIDATIRLGHGRERVEFLRAEDFKPPPLPPPPPPPAPATPSRPSGKGPPPLPSRRSTKDGSS